MANYYDQKGNMVLMNFKEKIKGSSLYTTVTKMHSKRVLFLCIPLANRRH